jgi:hypothetical protein
MLADGEFYSAIEQALPCYRDYVNRWRRRFVAKRLNRLQSRHYSQPPSVLTAEMEARILAKTRQWSPHGGTHWSTRNWRGCWRSFATPWRTLAARRPPC